MSPSIFASLATTAVVAMAALLCFGMAQDPEFTGYFLIGAGFVGGVILLWRGFHLMWRSRP